MFNTSDLFLEQGNRYRNRVSQEGRMYRRANNSDLHITSLTCADMVQKKQQMHIS